MSDQQVFHPTLGISRQNGDTSTCSKCGHSIPEDHVPLMMWSRDGNYLWVFCEACDDKIIPLIVKPGAAA